jgi:hypothetical protein
VIEAAATWVASSAYLSIIVAIEIDNEPQIANYSQWLYYKNYLVSANTIIKSILPSMATMFHDGWWGYGLWQSYFSASDNVVIDMHNYWAFSSSNASDAINGACAFGQTVNSSHIPIFVGEFSLSVDGTTPGTLTWGKQFLETQLKMWMNGAGGAFWSLKSMNPDGITQNVAWSLQELIIVGVISNTSVWQFADAQC